jgi:NADH:ubiquinone oxidoreductase subunit F (NADH-binding)
VHNVETLAHLALLARYGAEWFRQHGTPAEPGTFLATVTGAVNRPGVFEAGYGCTLGELLDEAAGPSAPLQSVLVGGYHGTWIPADPGLRLSREGLAGHGATPGAGVVIALPTNACGLSYTAGIARYLAAQSARQCGPCSNGLPRIAQALTLLATPSTTPPPLMAAFTAWPHSGGEARLVHEVERLNALVAGRGACHHPDGTARMVASGLRLFAREAEAHLRGRCTA